MTKHPMVRVAVVVLVLEILGALSLVAGILSFGQSAANNVAIIKLNAALDRDAANARATAKAAAAQGEITLHFLNEINFVCEVQQQVAVRLKLPPPSPGLCSLTVPNPKP